MNGRRRRERKREGGPAARLAKSVPLPRLETITKVGGREFRVAPRKKGGGGGGQS